MKRHIFGIIFIATTAVSCDALRCFQCEETSFLQKPRIDTCTGKNATICPEEANLCITNETFPGSTIHGCYRGNISSEGCDYEIFNLIQCIDFCDTDGCNSPFPTDGEFLSLGPDIAPPIPVIPPSLPPFSSDVQTSSIGPTNVIPLGVVPSLQPQPQPDTDLGELSCFQCSILNVDTLPYLLDECEGDSPRPCPASADNYCVIITTTQPGIHSVVRACDANISTTSCTTVGQVRTCGEHCSTDGCNRPEDTVQEATTTFDTGMQGGVGDGGAAKKVQISHFSLLNVVLDHAMRTSGGSETINEASLFNKVIGLLKKLL